MKKVRVTGFIFDSNQTGAEHTHGLYVTSWDGQPVYHAHPFSGITSYSDSHAHEYVGVTEPAPSGVSHVHRYQTVTYVNQGHTHIIQGVTGPDLPVPGGGHLHYFEGFTTVNGMHPHSHFYKGSTGNET